VLETGFLAVFLVPLVSLARFPRSWPPPMVVVWGYRWLMFRIMLGAGLIKIRGDACWHDLTCMVYFYGSWCSMVHPMHVQPSPLLCWKTLTACRFEHCACRRSSETQPIPNPMSWGLHVLAPVWFQKMSTMVNHIVELPAPFFLLMPRSWRLWGGIIQVCFQW